MFIEQYLQYRKDHNLDTILLEDMSELRKQFPFYIDGYDKDGRPGNLIIDSKLYLFEYI